MHMIKRRRLHLLCLITTVLYACDGGGSGISHSPASGGSGRAGSLARFAIKQDTLYVLAGAEIQVMRIVESSKPALWNKVAVAWDSETLFIEGEHLFVGARSGMHVYSVADTLNPYYLSNIVHARACDPVVVQGGFAYVTLRSSGNRCGSVAGNQLDVVDLSDITRPVLLRSYPMQEPAGLAVDGDNLFVCDGRAGLKRFSTQDPGHMTVLEADAGTLCHDVIAYQTHLISVGEESLMQFNYATTPMAELSEIHVSQ